MKYLTTEQILFIHYRLINETGGSHGIRDISLLQSAQARPKATFGGDDLYHDIFSKSAALMHSLIKNHPFIDGNKRTAIASASIFLLQNDFLLTATNKELENFTLEAAVKNLELAEIAVWFEKHTNKK